MSPFSYTLWVLKTFFSKQSLFTIKSSILAKFDDVSVMCDHDLVNFKDHRGFNKLMTATEKGDIEDVKEILNRGVIDVDFEVNCETAASLAFAAGHQNIVLTLLKANSKFPKNFSSENASDELKQFVELSAELHDRIKNEKEKNLTEIFTQNPTLRHFYDLNNNSALKVAIVKKKFSIIKILLENKIFLGPHEDMDEIRNSLSTSEKRELREIHMKSSSDVFDGPLTTLMSNCKLGPDNPKHPEHLAFMYKAFCFLLQIPSIAIYLQVVAASRVFKIVFDFKRDSVTYLDPSAEPYTDGLFYFNGRIYVAALDMLDPDRELQVFAVIAHELCHYAMYLVFDNEACPYYKVSNSILNRVKNFASNLSGNSLVNDDLYSSVVEDCERNMIHEEIVALVFGEYASEAHDAELIVRAPQMMVLYHESPLLESKKESFRSLFNYFDNFVVPEVEKSFSRIKRKFRSDYQKKIERQRMFIVLLTLLLGFSIVFSIFLGLWLSTPVYKWKTLNDEQKSTVRDTRIEYFGVDVRFKDIFANNSEIYDDLLSEHIALALDGKNSQFSDAILKFYDQFVFLDWGNMTKELRNKIMTSEINFQGENVKINEILSKSSHAFDYLTNFEFKELLKEEKLKISSKIETKVKLIIERTFMQNSSPQRLKKLLSYLEDNKIFLLSDRAGEGKSTTFRYFWLKLKKIFPFKWIEYVDLKKHFNAYDFGVQMNLSRDNELKEFLGEKLLNLDKFENSIFAELFTKNNTIFLWDGVDEISPFYTEFMLFLVGNITRSTNNLQLIATRPQNAKQFEVKFNINSWNFQPLSKSEQINYLKNYILIEIFGVGVENFLGGTCSLTNLEHSGLYDAKGRAIGLQKHESFTTQTSLPCSSVKFNQTFIEKFNKTVEKGIKIFSMLETKNDLVTNPLLVQMTAEISSEDTDIENVDIYTLYDVFITKKLEIIREKGKGVQDDVIKLEKTRNFNVMRVHQVYALKLLKNITIDDFNKLSIGNISLYGILNVFSQDDFDFVHRTFAEFFYALYIIENAESKIDVFDNLVTIYFSNNMKFYLDVESESNKIIYNFLEAYLRVKRDDFPEMFENIFEFINEVKIVNRTFIHKSLCNYLFIVKLAEKYLPNYDLNSNDFFKEGTYFFTFEDELFSLLDDWAIYSKIFGGRNFTKMILKFSYPILFQYFDVTSEESIDLFLNNLRKELNAQEIVELLFTQSSEHNQTLLMLICSTKDFNEFKSFWDFHVEFFDEKNLKNFLLIKDKYSWTILKYSLENLKTFKLMTEVYEKFFTKGEIEIATLTP